MGDTGNRRSGWAILATGLALALFAVVALWPQGSDSPESEAGESEAGGSAETARLHGARGDRGDERILDAPGVARDRVPSAGRFLRGRCFGADSDEPLGDAVWTVEDANTKARLFTSNGPQLAYPVPEGATGTWIVRVRAGDRIPLLCRARPVADRDVDLGVVKLRRGVSVRGSVRDAKDRPVVDAQVWLHSARPSFRSGPMLEMSPTVCQTGPDGTFVHPHPMPEGTYTVDLQDAPRLVSAAEVEVTADSQGVEIVCAALDPKDMIRGLVRESGGAVAKDVIVDAAPAANGYGFRVGTRTRADGTFVLFRPKELPRQAPMFLGMSRSRGGEQHERVRCPWGKQDLVLVLRPPQRLRVHVVAADDGAPIRGFAVQCAPTTGAFGSNPMRADSTEHRDGVAWVDGLRAGPLLTVVHPRGEWAERFVPTLPFRFEMPTGRDGEVQVKLRARAELSVEVAYRDGGPVVDSTVSLYALHGAERLHGKLRRTDLWNFLPFGGGRGPLAVRVATARTGEDGVARLDWCASEEPLVVRIEGKHPRHDEPGVVFHRSSDRTKILIERGGALHGRLVPAERLPLLRTLTKGELAQMDFLVRQGFDDKARQFRSQRETGLTLVAVQDVSRRLPLESRERFPIDADGRFQIDGVPNGRWSVMLERRGRSGMFEEIGPLAEVEIRGAAVVEREIDLRGFLRPGSISVVVRHNDRVPAEAELRAMRIGRGGVRCVAGQARCDATGRFVVAGLLPRRYELVLCYGPNCLPLGAPVKLEASGELTLARTVETRPVRLQLGPKAARKRIVILGISGAGKGLRFRRPIDAQGVLDLPFVPPGTYRIEGSSEETLVVERGTTRKDFVRSYAPPR